MKTVICIDRANNVRPYNKKANVAEFPSVKVGVQYQVEKVIENDGKKYYKLVGYPENHLYDVRAFNDVKE